ncbi:chromosome condensation complex Condensin, subunit G [Microbotryomycetes sp. JL201]|nr:chromosome condensation complex Condensin, subunit G [Microbotryomycetes sp. JL201]
MPGPRTTARAKNDGGDGAGVNKTKQHGNAVNMVDTIDSLALALDAGVCDLFQQAQHSVAAHRKLLNALYTLFERSTRLTTMSSSGRSVKLTGERMFGERIRQSVVHALGCKKGVEQADRIVKFVAAFVAFAVDVDMKRAEARAQEQNQDEEQEQDDIEGPSSRLVAQLLAFLLRGFTAKNKVARFRCVQLVALLVNSLGEVEYVFVHLGESSSSSRSDDTYQHLKAALLERVHDKESSVRMQAVVALSKLQEADADSDDEEEDPESNVALVLVDVLMHDPAAEVRRAALFNLLPSPITLPALVSRTLDVDTINRRAAFSHVLIDIPCTSLSKDQREEAIRRGLQDREEAVVKAAKKLVGKWVEETGDIIELLKRFDIFGGSAAQPLAEAIYEQRQDLVGALAFDGKSNMQCSLTPWTAFTARTYFEYLRKNEDVGLDDVEPVVTALAYHLQAAWTKLVVSLEAEEQDEVKQLMQEFVVGEIAKIAIDLDYGDEIGRRKMFELMREMLSHIMLPASLIPTCLDVLLKVTTSEKELMRIVVEIVQSLRADSQLMTSEDERTRQTSNAEDDDEDEETFRARRNKQLKSRAIEMVRSERRRELDLRCLTVVKALLERVTGALHENSMLHGLVTELVVPAIKQKDSGLRAAGLVCLGLVSLLDKSTALDSFELLARQSQDTEGELQVMILQALFDLLVLHGVDFGTERGFGTDVILGFLMSSLEQDAPEVVATAVIGTTKLILSGAIADEEILSRLALLYFASETADNQELRQCLSFFFPVYCYSNSTNQRHMANAILPTLTVLKAVYDDLGDKAAMVAPLGIGSQLIDWTDPQKVIESPSRDKVDDLVQFDLAVSMVKHVYTVEQKDERKLLCQLLCKLYIPDDIQVNKLECLLWLCQQLKENRPLADAVSRNAFERFITSLNKIVKLGWSDQHDERASDVEGVWKDSELGQSLREFVSEMEGGVESDEDEAEDDDADGSAEDQEEDEEEEVEGTVEAESADEE